MENDDCRIWKLVFSWDQSSGEMYMFNFATVQKEFYQELLGEEGCYLKVVTGPVPSKKYQTRAEGYTYIWIVITNKQTQPEELEEIIEKYMENKVPGLVREFKLKPGKGYHKVDLYGRE